MKPFISELKTDGWMPPVLKFKSSMPQLLKEEHGKMFAMPDCPHPH